jgi:hypothetical protein
MEAGCVVQKETPRNVGLSLLCENFFKKLLPLKVEKKR